MNVFTDPSAYATSILAVMIDRFGTEFLEWEPESIRMEVNTSFSTEIESENMNKLMSSVLLLTTDGFVKNINQFIATCNALSGANITPAVFDPATVEECAWGITEALLLAPETIGAFSAEVSDYIGARLLYEGWSKVPKVLKGATLPVEEANANDFTDDPTLFAGLWGALKENEEQLDETLDYNKKALLDQLSSLKLKNGSYDNLVKMLENNKAKG